MNTGLRISHGKPRPLNRMQMLLKTIRKFIGDYVYYRKRNHSHRMALRMVRGLL